MNEDSSNSKPGSNDAGSQTPHWGSLLAIWMASVVVLNGVVWMTGVPDSRVAEAIEQGAQKVEEENAGQESEDVLRKAIQLQRDTLPFWTIILALADFLFAPLALALRPLIAAISFSGVAALTGRHVHHDQMMADCVGWQGVWVLGLAVRVTLMVVLWRSAIETSVLILFPEGTFSAIRWVLLRQIDCFALIGWMSMAWSACRRRQVNLFVALLICAILAALEATVWASASLLVNLSMRLTLMPQ
jgi:hypothetical protein